ncbi:hypothetical protein RSOLAG1IB_06970 [Rhizoctonia solani AG-1 IB]|uniref:Uncharacterized protein n=1 Tax=Thanatephorus cucumeris (strain AG1-IB / isolate 7/3/14) TaxID=1108050 RepID=A0A0B7F9U9_THACB|nr:hypothetical protein RSOLAG1IB_06970 [Rhizoctonia solani AG-1 IB]
MVKSDAITAVLEATIEEGCSIVVKFAEAYDFEAHKMIAERSLAPRLLFHSEKPMYGGLWMIVMEFCGTSPDKYSGSDNLIQSSPLIQQDITLALELPQK